MQIHELKAASGSHHRRKIVGRGQGSGHGKTSCRGQKGQKARSGRATRPGFEGGQMPLIRRIPKRGFTSKSKKEFQIVNLTSLTRFKEGTVVNPEFLEGKGLIKNKQGLVKILGEGQINKPLTIQAHSFSKSAQEKINQANGKVELINA